MNECMNLKFIKCNDEYPVSQKHKQLYENSGRRLMGSFHHPLMFVAHTQLFNFLVYKSLGCFLYISNDDKCKNLKIKK